MSASDSNLVTELFVAETLKFRVLGDEISGGFFPHNIISVQH